MGAEIEPREWRSRYFSGEKVVKEGCIKDEKPKENLTSSFNITRLPKELCERLKTSKEYYSNKEDF